MSVFGKPLAVALGAVALSGTAMVPFAYALAGSTAQPQQITPLIAPAPAPAPAVLAQPEAVIAPAIDAGRGGPAQPAPVRPASDVVDAELDLPRQGRRPRGRQPVARRPDGGRPGGDEPGQRFRGRFGRTICGVIMQRGQFFNVHAYNPPRNARWRTAVEIARQARDGDHPPVIGNALFFHAAYAAALPRPRPRRPDRRSRLLPLGRSDQPPKVVMPDLIRHPSSFSLKKVDPGSSPG